MRHQDPATIGEQGWTLLERAFDDGDATALSDAADLLREALTHGPGHPDQPSWHHGLGLAMTATADMSSALVDWETALDELRSAAQAPHADIEPDALAGATAYALVQRYVAAEEDGQAAVDDLVAALDALRDPAGRAVPGVDLLRGRMRLLRFRMLGDPADQDEGLALLSAALPDAPEDMPRMADAWFDLAVYTADAQAPEIALDAVSRTRELLDPDDQCPDLDQLESDLLYTRWSSSDHPDLRDETIERLERLCHAAATPPADALVSCGELRLWRGRDANSVADLDAATHWLEQAEPEVDGDDAAIVALLLGTAATQRVRLTERSADREQALAHLGAALSRGLPEPEFALDAHRQRLEALLVEVHADRPTHQAGAAAQRDLAEAVAALDGHPDAAADSRAELAISLARTELAVIGLLDEPAPTERIARFLDIAAGHPAPPAGWQAVIRIHRSLLQSHSDTYGAAEGDFGRAHTIAVLRDTELPASAGSPMRRLLGMQSLTAGARTGDLGTLEAARDLLGPNDEEYSSFLAALAGGVALMVEGTDDEDALLAAVDRVIATAPDADSDKPEDRYVREYLLPAFQAIRAGGRRTTALLPELPDRAIGGPGTARMAAMTDIARSWAELAAASDPHRRLQALDEMTRRTRALPPGSPERGLGAYALVCTGVDRAERSGDPHGAELAIGWSAELLGFLGGPKNPLWGQSAMNVAKAHRLRGAAGDHDRSRELGQDVLRGHAWKVLLQSGIRHAITVARGASADAVRVARWCLHDRDSEGLVAALDAGRGLVLHAAVTTRGVVEQLRAVDEVELAREWAEAEGTDRIEVTGAPGVDLHGELRRRVLRALGAGRSSLLDPPSIERIRGALAACDADALIYLVPAGDGEPGLAVVVPVREPVEVIELPDLDASVAAQPADHTRSANRDIGPVDPDLRFGHPADLTGWAWRVAGYELGATAERLRRPDGARPRLVLVPFGALARVPWHAAGRLPELAAVSVTSSARLLCQATARPAWSDGAQLVIGNPTGDLPGAGAEARAVSDAFHPDATYLGRDTGDTDGAGTAAELLERLGAGAPALSLLHLACHGRADPEDPRRSHLRLADRPVSIDEVLALRPTAPLDVGTVCLAACSTNTSGVDYDEAFSIASAFLAAGARTVFATMWPVPDDHTSRLMFMIHHYLSAEGCAPAQALHRARRWARDPRRETPESMPASLCSGMDGAEDTISWAGFQHLGA